MIAVTLFDDPEDLPAPPTVTIGVGTVVVDAEGNPMSDVDELDEIDAEEGVEEDADEEDEVASGDCPGGYLSVTFSVVDD